jgi:hypothetical protein
MDPHIYTTSRAAQSEAHNDLRDAYTALVDNTKWSKSVIFISAYYGVSFADQLFRICKNAKMTREITLIFASAASGNLQTQVDELIRLRALLGKSGHAKKRIDIRITTNIAFLHSKIFAFTGPSGHKRYLLGSANFSSSAFSTNDEVLVLERGRHSGLESYIAHVTNNSIPIDDIDKIATHDIKDWRSFFREGFLYFKPARQVPYTVNCFVGHEFAETAKLLEKATVGAALQFHDQGSMGSLNLALLMQDRTVGTGGAQKRISTSAFSIETAFGLWVPSAYVVLVEDRIESSSKLRRQELMDQGRRLSAVSDDSIRGQIRLYLDAVDSLLPKGATLSKDKKTTIEKRIRRNQTRLIQALTDSHSLNRLSRPLTGVPVPDFWEDEQSGNELFETFAEYVAYKLSMLSDAKRKSSMISHLAARFGLDSDDDAPAVREKMESFFEDGRVWLLNDWPKAARDESDDDDSSAR